MPTCQSCGKEWSWKQTFRKMFSLDKGLVCPYCGKKQYQTKASKKNMFYVTLIILSPLLLPAAIELKLVMLLSLFIISILSFPYIINLANKEDPIFGFSNLIKNKKYLWTFLTLFLSALFLNYIFPRNFPLASSPRLILNIPLETREGINTIGIIALTLLLGSLVFLALGLNKYRVRLIILFIIVFMVLPSLLFSAYQRTVAEGIDAISYDRDSSLCEYERVDGKKMVFNCQMTFENHSGENVDFWIEFPEDKTMKREIPLAKLINENGPYEVMIPADRPRTVYIEGQLDIAEYEDDFQSGGWSIFNVMISSENKSREVD
ncbi:hypothetical protein CEY16_13325 [Halalkalibacillus sediminis]|uniref:Cxxc_20_cxxc protein n=1 Tax=Halalkalibacillus sediminis TaxID=2018042 RepID=A0A2I0QR20_9BACI|nr:TIGR04104 family putative zinc finger protein [Halalkalibacillus sediminis]PKR76795.1 hypothetical protein CEY16_13325 [Halalkalibacillus sediminis]